MQISEHKLRLLAHHINHGGLIAYPTEAVFGFGCDPNNESAVIRLLQLKERSIDKGLILIAAHFDLLKPYIDLGATHRLNDIKATWPGPTTWLLPAHPSVSKLLRGNHSTIAVRVTDHPIAAAISEKAATALVSTSANKTGFEPAKTTLKVRQYFKHSDLAIAHGLTGGLSQTTKIYDATSGYRIR